MTSTTRFTSKDLEALPDTEWWRYEIIDGELHVTKAPTDFHQMVCGNIHFHVRGWNEQAGLGILLLGAGVIFAEDDDVIPDLIWMSNERYALYRHADGHLHGPPELVIEV